MNTFDDLDATLDALPESDLHVLEFMREEFGRKLADVAEDAGLTVKQVRTTVRFFVDRGIAEFGPLINEDDGLLCGRGYYLNSRGGRLQKRLYERAGEPQ